MPQGRFSLADIDPVAPPVTMGQFRLEDIDPEPAIAAEDDLREPDFRVNVVGELPREASFGERARDVGISALKGAIGVPEAAVGLADIVTGGRVGRALEETVGFRPDAAKAILDSYYSDPQRAAFEEVAGADGLVAKAVAALSNPSVIAHSVVESLPLMGAGGVVGRAAKFAPRLVAGAIGEGVVSAGAAAEQTRQQSEDRLLTPGQAALAATSGAVTGAIGAFSGKLAQRLGIADVDTMLAGAATDAVARKGLARQVITGALQEGFLEELPQSVQEQVLLNVAAGRDVLEGVDDAAVMGALAGVAMGGGANVVAAARSRTPGAPAPPAASPPSAAAPPTADVPVTPVSAPAAVTPPGAPSRAPGTPMPIPGPPPLSATAPSPAAVEASPATPRADAPDAAELLQPERTGQFRAEDIEPSAESARQADVRVLNELTGASRGESHGEVVARVNNTPVGVLSWSKFDGELAIKMVEVSPEYQRQGIATRLLEALKADYPGMPIVAAGDVGTEAGAGWREKHGIVRAGEQATTPATPVEARQADTPQARYEAASEAARAVSAAHTAVTRDYRARKVDDETFLASKARHDAAQRAFDEAERALTTKTPTPKTTAAAPPFTRPKSDTRSRSVDASPVVRQQGLSRDTAFVMRWLADDLETMTAEPYGRSDVAVREAYEQARPGDERFDGPLAFRGSRAAVAGTPTQSMFKALGVTASRSEIARQIDRYLTGDAKTPAKGAAAALKLAPILEAAWDGRRFDFASVSDEQLRTAGIARADLKAPITLPSDEQPGDLVERFVPRSETQRAGEFAAADIERVEGEEAARTAIAEDQEREIEAMPEGDDATFDISALEQDEPNDAVRARALAEVEAAPDGFVQRYRKQFGHVLNADNASELFRDYSRSPEARAKRFLAVRPAAARVVELAFDRLLRQSVPPTRRRLIVFTSGGNASGKSTFAKADGLAAGIFDSTLSQLESSAAKIEQALAAGFDVSIRHVSRDPVDAWRAVLDRAMTTSPGRPVTIAGHMATHRGSRQTLLALQQRYATDPRVSLATAESATGGFVPRSLDWLREQTYPEGEDLRATLNEILDDARGSGGISDAVYTAAQGQPGRPGPRSADGVRAREQGAPRRAAETPVDRLDTGEAQPRLPADVGRVRDVEHPTPTEALPEQTLELRSEQQSPQQGTFSPDDIDSPQAPDQKRRGGGGSSEASIGDFANLPAAAGTVPLRPGSLFSPPPSAPTVTSTRPLEFPELVSFARELVRTPEVVKRFRNDATRGTFREGAIRLHTDLFKKGQEGQLAATLAHEIGHLIDWLPDLTLKRGNLLGRLRSLRGFLKHTFTGAGGSTIENATVRRELQALSDAWRPWDPSKASASFAAYRRSAKELYADAISVLLNNAGLLEAEAPTFYDQFFTELDRKPDARRAYFDLQELLSGTREELIAKRRAGVREMFEFGDAKAIDLERLRQQEQAASRKDLWLRLRIQSIDKNTPFIDRVKALEKEGVTIPEDDDPRYFLEERNYLGGKLKAFTEEHFEPVYASLTDAGIAWHDFGEALFYERIAAGDRSEIANPRGITPTAAQELLDALRQSFSADQRRVLDHAVTTFRAAVKLAAEQAFMAGLYKPEMYAEMKKNPAYVTFRVIDHLERNVTSKVHHQVGTLKDVTNPADATILKTLVTLRAIEYQRMKVAAFAFLEQHYPEDIQQAEHAWNGRGIVPVEPPDPTKQVLVRYYEKGALRGKYVDPYIADSLNNASVGSNWAAVGALRWINGYLRPIYTGLNLGFQSFNAARDFGRFWKNAPDMTLARAVKRYIEAVPIARVRAFGQPDDPSARMRQAAGDLREAEYAKVLGITFNDIISGRQVEDTQIEDTLAKAGIGSYASGPPKHGIRGAVGTALEWIKKTGDFIETLPKAAAIYEFKGEGSIADITPAQRSFIRRKLGSPDYLSGGTYKPVTNELLLFSNAITQAWRADLEVARDPRTRSGFWWKTAAVNVAPKLALFAALFLVPDDEDDDSAWSKVRRALEGVTEYDLTNYIPVPLGIDENGNTIYLRLPQDDAGRLIGGLTWKMLQALRGNREAMQSAMQVFDYTAGQMPSVTPVLQVGKDILDFASGRNVHDPFRSRFLFTQDELKARDSRTLKKFLGYEFQQLGGGIVWKFYPGESRPRERTTGQKILEFPVLSNLIGRWIRITDYGQVERLRATQATVQQSEARVRLDERAAVNDALREYTRLPPPAKTPAQQARLARDVVAKLYADADAKKRQAEYRDVLRKIRMGVARGKADPVVDSVMSATSTQQRVAILMQASKNMPPPEFSSWLRRAQLEGVVSAPVMDAFRREKQKGTQ